MSDCCEHLFDIKDVVPKTPDGCEECLKMGDEWVHLRLCATCGHVGCCDESKNKHASEHYHSVNHPLVKSFEPGEEWGWCYAPFPWVDTHGYFKSSLCDGLCRVATL